MRSDMKEVIIETGRHGGFEKGEVKLFQQESRNDFENSPSHVSMHPKHRGFDRKSQGDKLSPLYRFLDGQVGRKWDDVYSEICRVNDKRSMIGAHLLGHLAYYVHAEGLGAVRHQTTPDFFRDEAGILQKTSDRCRRPWRHRDRVKDEITRIPLSDGSNWELIENRRKSKYWFRTWSETTKVQYTEWVIENDDVVPKTRFRTETKHFKFKCNKKELVQIRDWFRRKHEQEQGDRR